MEISSFVAYNPLDQFEIRNIIGLNLSVLNNLHLSLTNIGLYLVISLILSFMFTLLTENKEKLLMNKWSLNQESITITVKNLVLNQISGTNGQIYFPFIYTLFMFILINNLLGMVPYNFASTSHFVLTFSLSFTIVLGATLLGLQKHGLKFFSLFVPAGCPLGLLPLLVVIEFISYLSRCVSLGLRLGANVMSGHMLLNILSGFIYKIMASGIIYFIIGLIPLAFVVALCGLELAIAFIQAYVFVILTSSYIKDALYLH
jgi:F-type H+-transporting ATPase subunit a